MDILNRQDAMKYSNQAGGRNILDAEVYHVQPYAAAGQTSLNFFNVNGKQQDLSGTPVADFHISNMVMAGKMDEDFLVTNISVFFDSKESNDQDKIAASVKVLSSGKLTLYLNQKVAFEIAPLGRCGSPIGFQGFLGYAHATVGVGQVSNALAPHKLKAPIFIREGDTFSAKMEWTTLTTISTISWVGCFLTGVKYYKA